MFIGKYKKKIVIVILVLELILRILGLVKLFWVIFCRIVFDKVRVILVNNVMIILGSFKEYKINFFLKVFCFINVGSSWL